MSPEPIFQIHLVLGYVAWLLCFGAYVWPWLKSADGVKAHRAIATLHSFRFFGLVFMLPGVVGSDLPASFCDLVAVLLSKDANARPTAQTAATQFRALVQPTA